MNKHLALISFLLTISSASAQDVPNLPYDAAVEVPVTVMAL